MGAFTEEMLTEYLQCVPTEQKTLTLQCGVQMVMNSPREPEGVELCFLPLLYHKKGWCLENELDSGCINFTTLLRTSQQHFFKLYMKHLRWCSKHSIYKYSQ